MSDWVNYNNRVNLFKLLLTWSNIPGFSAEKIAMDLRCNVEIIEHNLKLVKLIKDDLDKLKAMGIDEGSAIKKVFDV